MIHIYKAGGDWKTKDGQEYSIKAIEESEQEELISDGWHTKLQSALEDVKELTSGSVGKPEVPYVEPEATEEDPITVDSGINDEPVEMVVDLNSEEDTKATPKKTVTKKKTTKA